MRAGHLSGEFESARPPASLSLFVRSAATMKLLFSTQNVPEVGLLKGLLDDAGIHCEIRNENSSANFPGAAFQPELWVLNDTDYEKACDVRDSCCKQPEAGSEEPLRTTESFRGFYLFLGFVCLAACLVLLWQGL